MQRLAPGLIAHAAGICRSRHRAEELVQEAFVKPDDFGDQKKSKELTPQRKLEDDENLLHIQRALDRLDPDKRTMLMLRVNEHMSYEEIAEHLGVPVGTVMSRLNRARLALLGELDSTFDPKSQLPSTYDINRYREA